MTTAAVTWTFTAETDAVASQVNTNFSDLVTFINGQCIQKDGSLAMTQALTLSGAPTSALHAATKAYVDSIDIAPQYAQVVADQAIAATPTDLTGLTVTFTALAGRRIRVSGYATFLDSVVNNMSVQIREGAAVLQEFEITVGEGIEVVASPVAVLTPSAGAHTYKLTAVSGTGATLKGAATVPCWIVAEDIGPA